MMFMMIFMTAMMVLMSFRSGTLALYWIVGNLYTIVQTIINRKTNEIKWEKSQANNTITGVKVTYEKPKKEKKEKLVKEPKTKEVKETKLVKTDEEVVETKKDEIVEAEFEEIDNSNNKE